MTYPTTCSSTWPTKRPARDLTYPTTCSSTWPTKRPVNRLDLPNDLLIDLTFPTICCVGKVPQQPNELTALSIDRPLCVSWTWRNSLSIIIQYTANPYHQISLEVHWGKIKFDEYTLSCWTWVDFDSGSGTVWVVNARMRSETNNITSGRNTLRIRLKAIWWRSESL